MALAIFVQVFWSMLDARNRFQKQIPELTQQLEFVENGKREWARLLEHSGKVLQSSHQNSEAIIKSAEKIGVTAAWKTASSLKATGVSSFDDFVNWLEFLRTNYGLKPIAAKIETQNARKANYEALQEQITATGKDQISTTDPDAQSVVLQRGITVVGYNIQGAVDAKHKLVTHFDTGSVNDTNALAAVAIETKNILQVNEMDVLADKGYHTGEQIHQCEQNNITTYVSPKEPASNNPDIFHIKQFIYDAKNDCYTCPANQILTTNGTWYTHSSKGHKSDYKFQ